MACSAVGREGGGPDALYTTNFLKSSSLYLIREFPAIDKKGLFNFSGINCIWTSLCPSGYTIDHQLIEYFTTTNTYKVGKNKTTLSCSFCE